MSEENTQAVAPATEPAAQSAAEVASAQSNVPDLDSLLSEYDTQVKPQPAPAATQPQNDVVLQLQKEVENLKRSHVAAKERDDLTKVIKNLKGDAQVPDWAVRGWLSTVAEQNPGINDIWNNRESNPSAAKKLVASLKKQWDAEQAKNKPVDVEATTDKLAVAAAVRGTSSKTPEEPKKNYGGMNNTEFRQELSKYGL
jgi:hypothetical protein